MSRRRTEYLITVWLGSGRSTSYIHTASDATAAVRAGRRHYAGAVAVEVSNVSGGSVLATWGSRAAERRSA